jgi:hypothetical protein
MPLFWKGKKPECPYLEYTCRFPMAMTEWEFFAFIAVLIGFGIMMILLIFFCLNSMR